MAAVDPADFDRKIRAAFAPRSLGVWPTPLERRPDLGARLGVGELWIKREDRSSPVYGGNKVRGLEFLFRDIGPGDVALTLGGWGSTHCLAVARHARTLGAQTVVAQFPQGASETARVTARATAGAAAACFRSRSWLGFPRVWLQAWIQAGRLGRRRYIPGGGAVAAAVLGQALGALELGTQLETEPEVIVTPLGSGGTAAGLLLGCTWLGWRTRVVGVQVAPRVVANAARVRALVREARGLLASRNLLHPRLPDSWALRVVGGMGRRYGEPTPAGETARAWSAECGLTLDSTYGGKALAAVPGLSKEGVRRVVFWHTYADPGEQP